jgi:Lysylphosphatidylglycerol synthase TM region
VFAPVALATGAADGLADAVGDAHVGWLLAAVGLHVAGQLTRGLAWGAVLRAAWADVSPRQACAWYVCGAGLTGVLSARGGDVVRMGLAKRELPGATWPALAGTLAAEGSFEVASGVVLALVALGVGVGGLHAPSPLVVGAVVAGTTAVALLAVRSPRLRRVVSEVGHGMAALREPGRFVRRVLPWQVAGRLLRLASVGCFLYAFGLPAGPAVVIAVTVMQGSGRWLPLPGAGTAAAAAALLATLPAAAGHPVDAGAVGALALAQPALLTLVGVTVSLTLLTVLLGARTPRALIRAARLLTPQPAGVKP